MTKAIFARKMKNIDPLSKTVSKKMVDLGQKLLSQALLSCQMADLNLITHLPTYLFTYLPIYLPTYLPIYLNTYLPTYPTIPKKLWTKRNWELKWQKISILADAVNQKKFIQMLEIRSDKFQIITPRFRFCFSFFLQSSIFCANKNVH